MKDEFEERLHDMLQDRGATPLQTPQAPPKVLRRARRRQLSTALVSGATAVAVVGGAILGAQALRGNGGQPPLAETHGDTRSVVFNGYGVTYPYDWALQSVATDGISPVDPGGPEQPVGSDGNAGGDIAEGAKAHLAPIGPVLQLSNRYPDHLLELTCDGAGLSTGGVAFQVRFSAAENPADAEGLQAAKDCPDGSTLYSGMVASGDLVFGATGKVGADATEADRQALLDAYDSIDYPSGDTGVIGGYEGGVSVGSGTAAPEEANGAGGPKDASAGQVPADAVMTVVAGGVTESGDHWVMTADPTLQSGSVEMDGMGMGWSSANSGGGEVSPLPDLDASVMPMGRDVPSVVWGSVAADASSVEVRPTGADPIDVPLLAAPAVTGIDRQYFLSELPDLESDTGTVVALRAGGDVVGRQDYDLGDMNSVPGYPGDCPLPEPTTSGPTGDGQTSGGCSLPAPPVCRAAKGDPGSVACLVPCPDTPVSSDGNGSEDASNACTVDPPTCVHPVPVPDATTGSDRRPPLTGCPPPPYCVPPDPGTDDPATPAEEPAAAGGDTATSGGEAPNGGGCSYGGGVAGSSGSGTNGVITETASPCPTAVPCEYPVAPEPESTTGR